MTPEEPRAEIVDVINIGTALELIAQRASPPMATCPRDNEPLVTTMERAGAEFLCMVCGAWYGFLSPKPAVETPELNQRYDVLKAAFDRGARSWSA